MLIDLAEELGIDDQFANRLPEDKGKLLEKLQNLTHNPLCLTFTFTTPIAINGCGECRVFFWSGGPEPQTCI
jgi:hypothetical protein